MLDLLGMQLKEAIEILSTNQLKWHTIETSPYNKTQDGYERIIKQECDDDKYILTVCRVPDVYK